MTRRSVLMISKLYGISGETEKRINFLTEQAESADGRFYLTLISELADVWTERAEAEKNVTKKASYLKNAYELFLEARGTESFPMAGMDEMTVDYLIAALAIRNDQPDVAKRMVSGILGSFSATSRMKDKARALLENIDKN